jgi:hypothetical protein
MKRLTYLLIFVASLGYSQSNLVFNRVLEMAITATNTATVPEGKVWKVELASQPLYVDKPNVDYGIPIGSQPFSTGSGNILWLSENSTISVSSGVGKVSILEFNVVPTSTGTGSGSGGGGVSSDGLVFSEVINQFIPTSSVTGAFGTVAGSFIVPEGKIWKIHKMTHNKISTSTGGFISLNGSLYVSMDGIPIYGITTSYNINSSTTANNFLTPGTYELKWYQGSGAGGPFFSGTITHLVAIEYNMPQ